MEQPCYKCGQAVEEGIPFCPHCSAPQIRVVVATPVGDVPSPVAEAVPVVIHAGQSVVGLGLPFRWSETVKPCALAAMVASLLMSLGLNPFVAMISVGFLAVVLYRQRQAGTEIRVPVGIRLGALSGLLWFAIASVLETLIVIFLHKGPEIRAELITRIGQAASQTNDPQALAVFAYFKTPAGLELLMVSGIVMAFFASIILGGIGGALAAAILGRSRRS